MRGGLYANLAALSLLPLAAGCVQATRHSNTMVFGTNTSLGLKVGTGATQVPSITFGYDRQEAVIMPLVANTDDNGTHQTPCDLTSPVQSSGAPFVTHPCALVGTNGKAQDSYSVLASFGAKFDGQARADGSTAKGGLAQYFATGIAAQLLAYSGGASVVAVGEAAAIAAATKPDEADVKALFGDQAVIARGTGYATAYDAFQPKLIEKISNTRIDNLPARITAFEAATFKEDLANDCPNPVACVDGVRANDPYRSRYGREPKKFDDALANWATP